MIKDGQSGNVSLKIKISESGSSYGHLDITQVQVVLLLPQSYFILTLWDLYPHTYIPQTHDQRTNFTFIWKHLSLQLALRDDGNHWAELLWFKRSKVSGASNSSLSQMILLDDLLLSEKVVAAAFELEEVRSS